MGRKGTGVEVRGKAIRIQFSLHGEVVRRTLRRDGVAIPSSPEDLCEAERLAAEIRSRIAAGSLPAPFPNPSTSPQSVRMATRSPSASISTHGWPFSASSLQRPQPTPPPCASGSPRPATTRGCCLETVPCTG